MTGIISFITTEIILLLVLLVVGAAVNLSYLRYVLNETKITTPRVVFGGFLYLLTANFVNSADLGAIALVVILFISILTASSTCSHTEHGGDTDHRYLSVTVTVALIMVLGIKLFPDPTILSGGSRLNGLLLTYATLAVLGTTLNHLTQRISSPDEGGDEQTPPGDERDDGDGTGGDGDLEPQEGRESLTG